MSQQNVTAAVAQPAKAEVEAFRASALANGYEPIAVKTRSKIPSGTNWQHGHGRDRLIPALAGELSTGILARGLRILDVDIDDPSIAYSVEALADEMFRPSITRIRGDSARLSVVYRAADGAPPKREIKGATGKIEFLGDGQHFVAHGVHPDGAAYVWQDDRGPRTTPVAELPAITEEQVTAYLERVRSLIGVPSASAPGAPGNNVVQLPHSASALRGGVPAAVFVGRTDLQDMAAAAQTGLELHWFKLLTTEQKNALLREIVALPNSIGIADAPRGEWLRMLFGLADAERLGATEAREIALEWSRSGRTFNEQEFNRAWASFKAGAT